MWVVKIFLSWRKSMELLKRFVREEEGQGLVEYALIIGLISIVAIAALSAAGGSISEMFEAVKESLGMATDEVKQKAAGQQPEGG